jgi:glycosyltransferase involved in cell wall biosynthesis
MTVSLICAAFNRPQVLPVLLHCLRVQTHQDWECLVMDESPERVNLDVVATINDDRIQHVPCDRFNDWGQSVKRIGAEMSQGAVLGFPNDDAYYTPTYLERMAGTLKRDKLGLVYCDWLFDIMGYVPWCAQPVVGHIDVGGFLVTREAMKHVPWTGAHQTADGEWVQAMVAAGIRHGKAPGVLYVKN